MVVCGRCKDEAGDAIQCTTCKLHFHYGCSGITEKGYNKLGDRKSTWKCVDCKSPQLTSGANASNAGKPSLLHQGSAGNSSVGRSPQTPSANVSTASDKKLPTRTASPSIVPALTLENVMEEFNKLNKKLSPLLSLVEDFRSLKSDVADLKHASQDTCLAIEEVERRLSKVEGSCKEINALKEQLSKMDLTIAAVQRETTNWDKWSRLNNVEIKGVPLKNNENLFKILEALQEEVGYKFPKEQVNYISRVPIHGTKEKAILVSFINRYVKEEFVACARAKKTTTAADLGFSGVSNRVYVNDHLSPGTKILLTKTKALAKEKNYRYVWVKYSKIHVRKDDTVNAFVVYGHNDLNKIV